MGISNVTAQEKVIHLNTQRNLGRCERRQAQLADRRERTTFGRIRTGGTRYSGI